MKFRQLRRAILSVLYSGVGMPVVGIVSAQNDLGGEGNSGQPVTNRVVTGSRIAQSQESHHQPLRVIQRDEIEASGLTSLGDLLRRLPQAGSSLNTLFNGGGNGSTYVDLRNLGSDRTLVLINGRRTVTSLGDSTDLNNIPLSIVQRIEVLTEGATAIYGSDAIAGVVNIITRGDFSGLQANARIGEYDEGDGQEQAYDFSLGVTGDRSHVFFNVAYLKQEPVLAGDRAISQEPQFGTGNRLGSSATPFGRFFDTRGNTITDLTCPLPAPQCQNLANYRPWNGNTDPFNFAPVNFLLTSQERTSIFTQGRYDLTGSVQFVFEAGYSNRISSQQQAPTPMFVGPFGGGNARSVSISAMNPYNPFGMDLAVGGAFVGRRLVEAGPRTTTQDVDAYHFDAGVQGEVQVGDHLWNWDLNYQYGKIQNNQVSEGLIGIANLSQALGPADGCVGASNGCVPLNVFGAGGITPAMANFLLLTAQDAIETERRAYSANLGGELWALPAGDMGFAAGLNSYREQGSDLPDALITSAQTNANARRPTAGDYSVDEVYVEFSVPLLAERPGVELLELHLATRYSDLDPFGDTTNSKVGFVYQPISDLIIRGSFSQGFNTPTFIDAFLGTQLTYTHYVDPCSDMLGTIPGSLRPRFDPATGEPLSPGVPLSQSAIDSCVAQGVNPNGSYIPNNGGLPPQTVGGNPQLSPESADTTSFGVAYSPKAVPGFDVTVDYYKIDLDRMVAEVGFRDILNLCTGGQVPQYCDRIVRESHGDLLAVDNTSANHESLTTSGWDLLSNYTFPVTRFGSVNASLNATYLGEYTDNIREVAFNPSPTTVPRMGEGQNYGDFGLPRWKANLSFNWNLGDWDATYGMQYIHHQTETCGVSFEPTDSFQCASPRNPDPTDPVVNKIGSVTYHDLQLSYHLRPYGTRISVGVDNVWDKGPPISTTAFANSFDATLYRVPGRFGYVRLTVDF